MSYDVSPCSKKRSPVWTRVCRRGSVLHVSCSSTKFTCLNVPLGSYQVRNVVKTSFLWQFKDVEINVMSTEYAMHLNLFCIYNILFQCKQEQ